ncbi:FtsX-like permease family protein [Rhodococcus sp. G-MC3]|uniref:FtsX-like permease family protein n=1 Tax=Rhodococcus sp. G-MC3 TaxID=3046209 RepID=UPI0024B89A28|nr:FtsX-like permease family protein [Rhodococcus sp. G-MC3]MDJ0393897.1 FtsX-like permease family protein [Rhodococcus sp. G-MC3]
MIKTALSRFRVLGLRDLRTHWVRSLVSAAVVAVAAGLLIAVLGTYGSLTGSVERLAVSIAGNADLEVVGATDSGFDSGELDVIRAVPGVQQAVPLLRGEVVTDRGPLMVLGVDASITALDSDLQSAVAGSITDLTRPGAVLVGPDTGLSQGQTFEIAGRTLTAVGVVTGDGTDRIGGGNFVIAPLQAAQSITDRPGQLDSIFVLGSGVREAVTTAVDGRVAVMDTDFRAERANTVMSLTRNSTLMVALIAFVVAGFLVFNVMNMAIAKRRPTISVLRSIGGKRGTIVRDLLAEAAVIGLLAGLIGVPLGITMGHLAIGSLPPFLVDAFDVRIEYVLPVYAIPIAVVLCVVACVAASALAAIQVYRISPVEALAVGGAETTSGPRRALTVTAAVVGSIGVVGAVLLAVTVDGQAALAAGAVFLVAVVALCIGGTRAIVSCAATLPRRWGGAGRLATATVERAPGRIWATVMTIVVAVAVCVGVSGALDDLTESATSSLASMGRTDVYVSLTSSSSIPAGGTLRPEVLEQVRATPGVSDIVEGQWAYATIDGDLVAIQGVADGSNAVTLSVLADDIRDAVLRGDGVAVSRSLGDALGVSPGSILDLPTPTGTKPVEVLAVVDYLNAAGGTMALSLPSMQQWFERPGATYLEISVNGSGVQEVLDRTLPPEVNVYSGKEALDGASASIAQAGALAVALQWIVALVAAVALLNTLMLSVLERRRELGVLRAMGGSRGTLGRMVLAEALAVGIVGGVLGIVIGAALQYLSTLILGASTGIDIDFTLSPTIAAYALVALLLSLLGSAPPALHAARSTIVDAIAAD